jgi:CRISPR/Cas system CMR subunit Cmr4 (Cas7 group RAMP superfamily)
MNADDVKEKNQLINSVLTNFEQQLKRDYKAYEREKHQNVLIAKLNYEQQLHLIDANRKHLELSEQKKQIIEEAVGLDIQGKVSTIKDSLKSLQEELAQQCRDLSLVLGPINTPHLMEIMKRMKHALEDVTFQNAYLVLNNNELTLENSYMTPVQRSTIDKIRADRTRYYTQQRVAPHYIEAYPQGTVMFQPHNNMQILCSTHVNTEELLREVDEIIHNKGQKRGNLVLTPTATDSSASNSISDAAEITAFTGKGKRSQSNDRPDSTKYPRTDDTTTQGSSTVSNTVPGKGKTWQSPNNNSSYF